MPQIIDGKEHAKRIIERVQERVDRLKQKNIKPRLDVIFVGNDPASSVYVNLKKKKAEEIGIISHIHNLDAATSLEEIITLVQDLNQYSSVHGILVQIPLPHRSMEEKVMRSIAPEKDVDGLHPINQGKLLIGETSLVPCTPKGCLYLIKQALGKDLAGKHAVVMGRSAIVGRPLGVLLLNEDCTVTTVHSRTVNPQEITRQADILVTAMGKPNLVDESWIKPGACVIDVGISRQTAGLVGDVNFESAQKVAGYITPVPGGVGPMTIAMLMENTVEAAELKMNHKI